MKEDRTIGKVYETSNLNQFKILASNRDLRNRVTNVKKSIEENGWINSPIVVNEKYEVIDGQARLQACKELGVKITYTISEGLGIKDCRIMNSVNSNWSCFDYIKSYADDGDINYKYIYQLCLKMRAEWGKAPTKILRQISGKSTGIMKQFATGEAVLSVDTYNEACSNITYLAPIVKVLKEQSLCTDTMLNAVYFAARKMPNYARDLLPKAFERRCSSTLYKIPGNMGDALAIIDDIYNYKRRKDLRFSIYRVYEDEGLY